MPAQEKSIPACSRCRKRKTRCDTGRPLCGPCQRSGAACLYFDPEAKTELPRGHICELEETLRKLELDHSDLFSQPLTTSAASADASNNIVPRNPTPSAVPEAPEARMSDSELRNSIHTDLIDVGHTQGESHYVGSSSGLHIARAMLETAERNNTSLEGLDEFDISAEASESRPLTQTTVATLPFQETAIELAHVYFAHFQVQYPILEEHAFMDSITQMYSEATAGVMNDSSFRQYFILRMVLAIALHCLSKTTSTAAGLASNYSTVALKDLPDILLRRDIQSLQCLLLVLLFSLLRQTQLPIWYMSGLCTRMCINLGIHNEKIIRSCASGIADEDTERQMDSKRRLFWVTYIFDRTLSSVLGRPITIPEDMIDVSYPVSTITQQRQAQTTHWLKLQRLQTEILQKLYGPETASKRDESDTRDSTAFVVEMSSKLAEWAKESVTLADQGPQDLHWWRYWHCNTLVFLHRPALTSTQVDIDSYTSALELIQISFVRLHQANATSTWLDLQYQFNAGTMLLLAIWSSPDVRERAKREWVLVKSCFTQWEQLLSSSIRSWPKGSRAAEILVALKASTVALLEKEIMGILPSQDVRAHNPAQKSYLSLDQDALMVEHGKGLSKSSNETLWNYGESLTENTRPRPNWSVRQGPEFGVSDGFPTLNRPDDDEVSDIRLFHNQAVNDGINAHVLNDHFLSWDDPTAAQQSIDQAFDMMGGLDGGILYQGTTAFAGFDNHDHIYMDSVLNFQAGYPDN